MLTHFKKKGEKLSQVTPIQNWKWDEELQTKDIVIVSLQDCLTRNVKENSLSWNERTLAHNKKIYESIKLTDKCTCIVKFKIWWCCKCDS